MSTKKKISRVLNDALMGEEKIDFTRLNKNEIKLLIDKLPFSGLPVDYEGFLDLLEEEDVGVKYLIPLEPHWAATLEVEIDGLLYQHIVDIEDQKPEEDTPEITVDMLDESTKLWYRPEDRDIGQAKEENRERIEEVIKYKFPNAEPKHKEEIKEELKVESESEDTTCEHC